MKTLIVDDEFVSRIFLQGILEPYGTVHVATNGAEAIDAVCIALDASEPYDLICMDLLMPILGGEHALTGIRKCEQKKNIPPASGAKVILTTGLQPDNSFSSTRCNVLQQMKKRCDGHIVKPIKKKAFLSMLKDLKLIPRKNEVTACAS